MNSVRKLILSNIVDGLKQIRTPKLGKISTRPEDFARLARTAFPFVQVEITDESKEDIAMEWRLSTLTIAITVHVDGKNRTEKTQAQLADIISKIEAQMELDRTRGGVAQLTELLEIGDMQETGYPTVSQTLSIGVQYTYARGNT
jgi:hypothetical protein